MTNHTLRFLSADDVRKSLSMNEAIELMREAFVELSTGKAVVPERMSMSIVQDNGQALFMPAYLPKNEKFGVKIVSVMEDNPMRGLPQIHALVMVFDSGNGQPLAVMDGEYLTALRTGAASGLATDLLARRDSQVAAIVGAGAQGRTQLEAVCAVRYIQRAYIFNRSSEKAAKFASEMSQKLSIPVEVSGPFQILKQVDIICTATTSRAPVFSHSDLKPGVHINAIGAYRPDMCEIPAETIVAAKVVVDQRQACWAEAGDLIQPLQQGLIKEDHIYAEIGEVAEGVKEGRASETEITVFKSVGNAVQDLVAAGQILVHAKKLGLGTELLL